MTPDELEAELRDIGAKRYHRLHPFHGLLHGGKCTKGQVQAWALNRYYYQAMIPIKDASLIARCEDPAIRREWRSRLHDHDGEQRGRRRHRALAQADRRARARPRLCHLAARAAARHAGSRSKPMCISCARRRLLEAIASSLTELFSPVIIGERVEGMLKGYAFVTAETLAYFAKRPPQAKKDSRFRARLREAQRAHAGASSARCSAALEFKCGVLWSMLDALHYRLCGAGAHSARRLRAEG